MVASSTISTFGYAMNSLKLATPSRTMIVHVFEARSRPDR